jgi:hypothetical protein
VGDRVLHSALREPGTLCDPRQRDLRLFLQRSPPKPEVDQEGGRSTVVPDEVAQQNVDYIRVELDRQHAPQATAFDAIAEDVRLESAWSLRMMAERATSEVSRENPIEEDR